MSTWKELCDRREVSEKMVHPTMHMRYSEFDKIRAVVEAAKQVSDSHQGYDDTAELGYLNITLRELGVTNETE